MSNIKPGRYVVNISAVFADVHGDTWAHLVFHHPVFASASSALIPASALHPLPAGISAEAQAVLDVGVRWQAGDAYPVELVRALSTYRATLTPPDPVADAYAMLVAAAKKAANQLVAEDCPMGASLLREAIASVEAARGGK